MSVTELSVFASELSLQVFNQEGKPEGKGEELLERNADKSPSTVAVRLHLFKVPKGLRFTHEAPQLPD